MICVECGRDAPRLIRGSCPECFTSKTRLVTAPEVLDVELCSHCDARHVGAHWLDPAEDEPLEDIRAAAVRAATTIHPAVRSPLLDIAETAQDEKHYRTTIHLQGEVEDTPVDVAATMTVRLRRSVCDRCSRMFGGYYAAIIQLRAVGRDVTIPELEKAHRIVGSELDRLRASGSRDAFLTKSGAVPGGFDYYMGDIEGTRAVARTLLGKLGANLQETAKLAGRKEGNDIYRVTFLVRIREFAPDDFALLRGEEPVQVSSYERGKAIVYRLQDHQRDRVDESDLKRIGGSEALVRAVVVSRSPTSIQLLDPVTYATRDVAIPEGWVEEGETVWALRHEDTLYLPRSFPDPPKPPEPKRRRRAIEREAKQPGSRQ